MKLGLRRLEQGTAGVAAAMLLPRVTSAAAHWALVVAAGTGALIPFVSTTYRGSAAVSVIATALAPVVGLRRGAVSRASGRHLIAGACLLLAVVAFAGSLLFEATVGIGWRRGLAAAVFAAATLLGGPNLVVWPLWQRDGTFRRVLFVSALALAACLLLSLSGRPELAAIALGVGGAIPSLFLVGPFRVRRAAGYAWGIVRRALPISAMTFATAIVFPMALSRGETWLGADTVGRQGLYWSCMVPLGLVSQTIAIKMLERHGRAGSVALRTWTTRALLLVGCAGVVFGGFRWFSRHAPDHGAASMPWVLFVVGASVILSDPLCLFFCPPEKHRRVAVGSVVVALSMVATLLFVPSVVTRLGVCGPSGVIFAARLFFLTDSSTRTFAYGALACLVIGYSSALTLVPQ